MEAVVKLLVVVMVEAGKVPLKNAMKIGENVFRAITGGAAHDKNQEKN